jgi:glycosyltransferase involved in cell wall biosynthesis
MSKITVAICTWNRANLLDQTLTSLRQMIVPEGTEWELLVVNNNCTDETDTVVARHSEDLPLRLIHEARKGKSNAANTAMDAATGDLILWTDDDVLVSPDWLARFAEAARRHPRAAVFGGVIEPWFPVPPDHDMVEAFSILASGFCGLDHGDEERPLSPEQPLFGANMAFRLSAIAGTRFDPTLGPTPGTLRANGKVIHFSMGFGEETSFIRTVRERGGECMWVPSMKVRHYVDPRRMSLPYLHDYYAEYGRQLVRIEGLPEGGRVLGVPHWLLKAWLGSRMRSALCLVGSRRLERFRQLRQYFVYRGMMRECLAMRREKSRTSQP